VVGRGEIKHVLDSNRTCLWARSQRGVLSLYRRDRYLNQTAICLLTFKRVLRIIVGRFDSTMAVDSTGLCIFVMLGGPWPPTIISAILGLLVSVVALRRRFTQTPPVLHLWTYAMLVYRDSVVQYIPECQLGPALSYCVRMESDVAVL
jgi:hypothetical protein